MMGEARRRKTVRLPIRLMLRSEGDRCRAYLGAAVGQPEHPDGPVMLAAIRVSLAKHPAIYGAFIALMSEVMKIEIRRLTGVEPEIELRNAPPNERAGNA